MSVNRVFENEITIIESLDYAFKTFKLMGQGLKSIGESFKVLGQFIQEVDWDYTIDCVFSEQKKMMIDKTLEYNWYLPSSLNTGEYFELKRILDNKVVKEDLDKLMIEVIVRDRNRIEGKVVQYFNSRKSIAEEAFKCNELEMYYSSVVTLLTLIDGISNDLLEVDFFSRKNGKPVTKLKAEDIKDNSNLTLMEVAELYPLEIVTNLTVRAEKRVEKKCKDMFNRHAVMHGIDNNYGTYKNVCKCYAILSFLISIYEIVNKVNAIETKIQ